MPSAQAAARQVLVELELTSVIPARAIVPAVTTNPPESQPPSGGVSPADRWRLVREMRAELRALRRRSLPVGPWERETDLDERILTGEGLEPERIAYELRCTPTKVRRARLAAGCDPERGRRLELELEPAALLDAGMSYRAVAAATGIPRSTLHDHNRSPQP